MTDPDPTQPPANVDAERAVIGACLISPRALDGCAEHVTVEDFYRPAHQDLFRAMLAMRDTGQEVDALTLTSHLGARVHKLGGAGYLHDCMQAVPTAANAEHYAQLVADKATLRRLSQAATHISQLSHQGTGEVADIVERARASLDTVAASSRGDVETWDVDALIDEALIRYKDPAPPAVSTGWGDLDQILNGGLRPGTLTVIGARPNVGKTVIGANLATNIARTGGGALIFSLEMPRAEMTDRVLASVSRVDLSAITKHQLTQSDWSRVQHAAQQIRSWPLAVNDHPHLSLTGIRSLARDRIRSPRGLAVVVIDYIGLIRPADSKIPRQEQVAAFSRGLKLLAKELAVPVVALAQVNRDAEKSDNKRPSVHQLRESGAIEADADVVWLLHRDDKPEHSGQIDIYVGKNRHGGLGAVTLAWNPRYALAGNPAHLEAV